MTHSMNEISVTAKQLAQIRKLSDECTSFGERGMQWDNDRWLRGVNKILGYMPPLGEYKLVVSDMMVVRFDETR